MDSTSQQTKAMRSAESPWLDGKPAHLPCRRGELPAAVLFPGDPARVDRFATVLDDFHVLGQNREFRVAVGSFRGVPMGVCSTGIGGPSTEIALVEAAGLGCRYALRVGGTGAIRADIALGQLLAVREAMRGGGAASFYLPADQPALAHPHMLAALRAAANDGELNLMDAVVASTDSYYLGQGRPLPQFAPGAPITVETYRKRGADALEMEAETILAVGGAIGMIAGALLAVHANRATDEWLEDFAPAQDRMIRLGCEALRRLVLGSS